MLRGSDQDFIALIHGLFLANLINLDSHWTLFTILLLIIIFTVLIDIEHFEWIFREGIFEILATDKPLQNVFDGAKACQNLDNIDVFDKLFLSFFEDLHSVRVPATATKNSRP